MELHYSIIINAAKDKVWDIMFGDDTYEKWVKAFSENSTKEGEWKQGTYMNFIDVNQGGTKALLEVVEKPNRFVAKHIALITTGNTEDTESESAQKWMNSIEEYVLTENEGATTVTINMQTHEDFREMFDTCWPKALQLLKKLCET